MSQASRAVSPTPLERHLNGDGHGAVTPLDAFAAARRRFLKGERVDMQELAAELGVGRATLYRWVGSRDQLLGEILWSLSDAGLRELQRRARGEGVEWFMQIYDGFGDLIRANAPLRRFVSVEPEAALRVMTSKHSPQQRRIVDRYREILEDGIANHGLKPRLDVATLAFVLVRIGESFLWTDLITGEEPDTSKASEVARVLLS